MFFDAPEAKKNCGKTMVVDTLIRKTWRKNSWKSGGSSDLFRDLGPRDLPWREGQRISHRLGATRGPVGRGESRNHELLMVNEFIIVTIKSYCDLL